MKTTNTIDTIWSIIWKYGFEDFDLNLPIGKLFKYSSHIPLLFSTMELLPHGRILEFGSGFFSTPIFYHNYTEKFVTVEDDPYWHKKLIDYYTPKDGFVTVCSNMLFWDGKPYKPTISEITKKQHKQLVSFYEKMKEYIPIDILFIDQIKYGRSVSIDVLGKYTDILIYHDAQHKHRFYRDSVDNLLLSCEYKHFSYKIERNTTNIVIKNNIEFDSEVFKSKIKEYETRYFKLLGDRFDDLEYIKDVESVFIQL